MDVNLVLLTNDGRKKNFLLSSTVTVIGRRQDCDLCIPLMNVSRRHCELNQDENKLMVRDLGSRNGTFVDGEKVAEAELKDGNHLKVGPLEFTVSLQPEEKEVKAKKASSEFMEAEGHFKDSRSNETEVMEGFQT